MTDDAEQLHGVVKHDGEVEVGGGHVYRVTGIGQVSTSVLGVDGDVTRAGDRR